MISYKQVENALLDYYKWCYSTVENLNFTAEQLQEGNNIKNILVLRGQITEDTDVANALKYYRHEYLQLKLNHSIRVTEWAMAVARYLNSTTGFLQLIKSGAISHDIGQLNKATWSTDDSDAVYNDKNTYNPYRYRKISSFSGERAIINNHGRAGYYILFDEKNISRFIINPRYQQIVGNTIYYHNDQYLPPHFNQMVTPRIKKNISLSLEDNVLLTLMLQIIRDADRIDIINLYKIPGQLIIDKDFRYPIQGESIQEIAKKFEISAKEILDWNGITQSDVAEKGFINIPLGNIDKSILKISPDLCERFISNGFVSLDELSRRQDNHFITKTWWRLITFFNNINFVATLINVKESRLLEEVYNSLPDEYKPLLEELFNYVKETLVEQAIKNSPDGIYIKDKAKILT